MKKMKTVLWIVLILTAIIPIYAQQYDSVTQEVTGTVRGGGSI